MIGILKKQNGMNIVGQGGKIILFTLPSLVTAIWVHVQWPEIAALPASLSFLKPVGYLLLIPGVSLWLAAVVQLLIGFPRGELVTTCAYGAVRNPIYSSVTFFILPAVTLLTWSWVYLAASVCLYLGVTIFIGVEEKQLAEAFGEEYEAYMARVDRLIPWRRHLSSAARTGVLTRSARVVRSIVGALLAIVLILISLTLIRPWTLTWGATEAEVARALPGDELIARTANDWTHAATIDAAPEAVWPWIAQMGDDRGGFYSYTFIENLLQQAMLGAGPVYHNANRILPEFQNPQPGEGMVVDSLQVHAVEPGKWMVAAQRAETGELNWVWLWHIEPAGANQTRLVVRMALRIFPEGASPVVSTMTDIGSFVMGRRMVEGLTLRAEGRTEPAWIEVVEIALWLAALVAGLGAARLFVTRPAWQAPLLLGLAALFVLLWFTVWQPSIWLRLSLDVALFALLWWVASRLPRAVALRKAERGHASGSTPVRVRG